MVSIRLMVLFCSLTMASTTSSLPAESPHVPPGFTFVDLRTQANRGFEDSKEMPVKGWTNEGISDMRNLETGLRTFLGVPFDIIKPETNGGRSVLVLGKNQSGGGPDCENLYRISVSDVRASMVYFLITSSWTAGPLVGEIRIHTKEVMGGGPTHKINLIRGKNIDDWWMPVALPETAVATTVKSASFPQATLYLLPWKNPTPGHPISEIEFSYHDSDGNSAKASAILVAVTMGESSEMPAELASHFSYTPRTAPVCKDMTTITSKTIGVFKEDGFPSVGMPRYATPEFIADTLREAGYDVSFIDAAGLANPDKLNVRNFNVLIMARGEAYPANALVNIRDFVADGGGLLCPAGLPLGKSATRDSSGQWVITESNQSVVFEDVLPLKYAYRSATKPRMAVLIDKEYLPGLPTDWPLTGGVVSVSPSDYTGWSPGIPPESMRRLVASVGEHGELCALPLWFNPGRQISPAPKTSPCARYLFCGFEGESHPWNPKAWAYARKAIVAMTRIVATRDHVLVSDVTCPAEVSPGQQEVRCQASVFSPLDAQIRLDIVISGRDSGKVVYKEDRTVEVGAGQTAGFLFEVRGLKLTDDWAYDVVVTARRNVDGETFTSRDRNMFVKASAERKLHAPGLAVEPHGRWLTLDGKPWWGFGFQYSQDVRNHNGMHCHPDAYERDISDMLVINGNHLRTAYWSTVFGPVQTSWDTVEQRLHGLNSLLAELGVVHEMTLFTNRRGGDGDWGLRAEINPILDRDSWTDPAWMSYACRAARDLGRAIRGFPNVMFAPENETQYFAANGYNSEGGERLKMDPDVPAIQYEENVERWNMVIQQAVDEGASRKVITTSHLGGAVERFQSPMVGERPLGVRSIHMYSPQSMLPGGGYAFQINYGSLLAPNENGSNDLGCQDSMFALLMAERGAYSSLHMYRGNGWPYMTRWDTVYEERGIQTKQWGVVLRHIGPSDFRTPDTVLLFDARESFRFAGAAGSPNYRKTIMDLQALYEELVARGIEAKIVSADDLTGYPVPIRNIILIPGFVTTTATVDLINGLAARKCRVIAGGEVVTPGLISTLPRSSLSALERKGVKLSGNKPGYFYVKDRLDGGKVVIVTDASGKYSLMLGGSTYDFEVPRGRAFLMELDKSGNIALVKGYGSLVHDGKAIVTAPCDPLLGYVIAARDDKNIEAAGEIELTCEDQSRIKLAGTPSNAVGRLGKLTIVCPPGGRYSACAKRLKDHLASIGVNASISSKDKPIPGHIICLATSAKPGTAARKLLGITSSGKFNLVPGIPGRESAVIIGRARLDYKLSGLIHTMVNPVDPKGKAVLISGTTDAGLRMAVERFVSITLLGDYSVEPFSTIL